MTALALVVLSMALPRGGQDMRDVAHPYVVVARAMVLAERRDRVTR